MRTKFLTLLFSTLLMSFLAFSQDCVEIDFEQLPGGVPTEGQPIGDQYLADFGVSFILDNNQAPVIAQVGFPAVGFGSAFGDDAPAPGTDVGQFFLTDDGMLSGLESIGLLITFDTPLKSAEGCILDIDFGERFVMEARDVNNMVVLADTITDGDPDTGDGNMACWSIEVDDCLGGYGIASFRIKGYREITGFFGYGYDNFVFCFHEAPEFDVNFIEPACNAANGIITVSSSMGSGYQYSLDGTNFQTDSVFTGLAQGTYQVSVQHTNGCIFEEEIELTPSIPVILTQATPISCHGNDATIQANAIGGTPPYVFSINGGSFSSNSFFGNLDVGLYTLQIEDALGCTNSALVNITPNVPLSLNTSVIPTSCGVDNGSVNITPIGQAASFEYSINGVDFQTESIFENLAPGPYTILMIDPYDCSTTEDIIINTSEDIIIESIDVEHSTCEELNGALQINASGGTGLLSFAINDLNYQNLPEFFNLGEGFYNIYVIDEVNCEDSIIVEVEGSPRLRLDNIGGTSTDCGEATGTLFVQPSGGTGLINASINDEIPQPFYEFENLPIGDYQVVLVDELGCTLDTLFRIGQNECPIYIPNAFSPNGDGANDYFKIYPHPDFQGEFISLKIFDRWGEFVYEKQNYDPEVDRWDGIFLEEPMNPGVYVYVVELIFGNGREGTLAGDVKIIK